MNMDDILNQWDKMQAADKKKQKQSAQSQVSHKKANAPTLEEKARAAEKKFEEQMKVDNSRKVNMMEMWLRRYGTVDKDK
ncbi:MAG: DNA mismatch repair protein MutS, partial [Treponema sp.]|nr:DNA mismatch repair protein MutS [Treponema sp.]